jgi:hypothetical protein
MWKYWDEAPVLAGKFKSGEDVRFQDLLDNIQASAPDGDAWDALAGFAITSPNPGALTMTMLGMASDGVSYHALAECLLVARTSGRALARVLRDHVTAITAARAVVVEARDVYAGTDRDWRSKILAAPDPVPRPYEIHNREWRSSDQRPSVRY